MVHQRRLERVGLDLLDRIEENESMIVKVNLLKDKPFTLVYQDSCTDG